MTWRLSQHAAGQPLSHPQRLSLYSLRHSPRPSHLGPQGRHDRAKRAPWNNALQVIQGVLQGIWHHLKRVARMSPLLISPPRICGSSGVIGLMQECCASFYVGRIASAKRHQVEESCEISKTKKIWHKSGPSWKFGGKSGGLAFWANSCSKLIPIDIPSGMLLRSTWTWLVVSTPLKNISQLGWLFPIYGKTKTVPNHQPLDPWSFWPIFQQSLLSSGVIHVPVSPSLHR